MALGVLVPIEAEFVRRRAPRDVTPAIGQQDTADVKENGSDGHVTSDDTQDARASPRRTFRDTSQ